jgi:hypothetical protein
MSVITDIITGIAGNVGKAAIDIRTAITGLDPATAGKLQEIAANLEAQKAKADTDLLQGQLDINKVEAASPNLFIAGWRPAVGWVCVSIFAYNYIIRPLLTLIPGVVLPALDLGEVSPVLMGLLGLGAMRTVEKIKAASGNH